MTVDSYSCLRIFESEEESEEYFLFPDYCTVFQQSALPSFGGPTAKGNVIVTPMASAMTWPASVPATTTVGDLTARMLAYAKRASVTKTRANAHVTLASGVPSATTTATAASTLSVMQWQGDACAILVGPGGTAQSSVTVTTHHATSSQDAASAGKDCGVSVANDTANVSMASATRRTAHVPVHQGTVGSSAGSHVLLGSMVKTAGTGGVKK